MLMDLLVGEDLEQLDVVAVGVDTGPGAAVVDRVGTEFFIIRRLADVPVVIITEDLQLGVLSVLGDGPAQAVLGGHARPAPWGEDERVSVIVGGVVLEASVKDVVFPDEQTVAEGVFGTNTAGPVVGEVDGDVVDAVTVGEEADKTALPVVLDETSGLDLDGELLRKWYAGLKGRGGGGDARGEGGGDGGECELHIDGCRRGIRMN